AARAMSQGLKVDRTPSVGAIMQNGGGFGHVAIVESVLPNGDVSVSEMNAYVAGGGYNVVSGRIILAANAGQYLYIH
ncbi:MAG TPA: CHAP domain-containing protein, partial [Candidatus Saccharibacteria bacterium]|nr:CHAP domain-containing protein [Candidatus Saccharibacteria bacterium]